MISCWPFFRPGTKTYEDMDQRGYFIAKTQVAGFHPAGQALYDAFNPEARAYYWNLIDKALFNIGADAWWLDTTEPETEDREDNILTTSKTAIGNGARYANLFPLMTTTAVYEGQRAETNKKRVFILSRSAFAGQQRCKERRGSDPDQVLRHTPNVPSHELATSLLILLKVSRRSDKGLA